MPRNPSKTRCQTPGCRAWAMRGSSPPLCSSHAGRSACPAPGRKVGAPQDNQNRTTHSFCSTALDPSEIADLVAYAGDNTLNSELAIACVSLRRVLTMLLTGTTTGPSPQPLDP